MSRRSNRRPLRSRRRRGNILVLSVFLMILMMAMVAFAVDIGYLCLARAELQRTADSAADAAAVAIAVKRGVVKATPPAHLDYRGYRAAGGYATLVACAGTPGSSTIVLSGTTALGAISGKQNPVRVGCITNAQGHFVNAVGIVKVGASRALVFVVQCAIIVTISAVFFLNAGNGITLGTDLTTWYAPTGFATISLLLAIAFFAFKQSVGHHGLLGTAEEERA